MIRVLLIFIMIPIVVKAGIRERVDALLMARYAHADSQFEKYVIENDIKKDIEMQSHQHFLKNFVYVWRINSEYHGSLLVIVDVLRAKSAFITMMTTLDSTLKITEVDILDYNGRHGRNVMNSRWLAQFIGKNATSTFKIGSDVDAVTGATFSAAAIAKAMKRWVLLAQHIEQ